MENNNNFGLESISFNLDGTCTMPCPRDMCTNNVNIDFNNKKNIFCSERCKFIDYISSMLEIPYKINDDNSISVYCIRNNCNKIINIPFGQESKDKLYCSDLCKQNKET